MITPTHELMTALRTARAQCLIRVTQLANCRVCGDDHKRFEAAVQQLDQLIHELETPHATHQELHAGRVVRD